MQGIFSLNIRFIELFLPAWIASSSDVPAQKLLNGPNQRKFSLILVKVVQAINSPLVNDAGLSLLQVSQHNTASCSFSIRRQGIGNDHKIIGDSIRRNPAENEESAIGGDDIALLKKAVVHRHVGSNALGLGGARGLSLDAAMLLRGRGDP